MKRTCPSVLFLIAALLMAVGPGCVYAVQPGKVRLPPGFRIAVYSDKVPGARSMTLGDKGTFFVGTRGDKVFAVLDKGGFREVMTIARGLDVPNGVAFRDGALYRYMYGD